jgi:hypothetical protein
MHGRLTPIACALLLSSLAVPAANAGQQRTPAFRTSTSSLTRTGAFGSGGFTGHGHADSGQHATRTRVRLCPTFRAGYCPAPRA